MTLQQQIHELKKYHEALGTKLASLERQLEAEHEDDIYDAVADKRADEVLRAPTMERQNYAVSSDSSVMYEGRRYSFLYKGIAIEDVLIQEVKSNSIGTDGGDYVVKYIYHVREVKEPAKEWEIVEFRATGKFDGRENSIFVRNKKGVFISDTKFVYTEFSMLHGQFGSVKDGQFTIHAVRRLRDDTTWRVGMVCGIGSNNTASITKFEIQDGKMMVRFVSFWFELSLLRLPVPLFTTADGLLVPEAATVYFWHSERDTITPCVAIEGLHWANHYSTREAAQAAYDKWLFEQPVLTLSDIKGDVNWITLQKLTDFVKEKMAKK